MVFGLLLMDRGKLNIWLVKYSLRVAEGDAIVLLDGEGIFPPD